jgi:hypothetical protein
VSSTEELIKWPKRKDKSSKEDKDERKIVAFSKTSKLEKILSGSFQRLGRGDLYI